MAKKLTRRQFVNLLKAAAGTAVLIPLYTNCSPGFDVASLNSSNTGSAGDPPSPQAGNPILPAQGFGLGSETGTVENFIWTPGRDLNGKINLASWNLAPAGVWLQVSGTRLDSLDSEVKSQVPGWRDWGTEGWSGVTNAWNGLTIDELNSRAWLMASGGHAASSNNGIYGIDLFKMRWHVEKLPSSTNEWSDQYKRLLAPQPGTFSPCYESEQQPIQSPINDWYWDELFWDRRPTSRHTYSASAFIPETNELIMSTRRLWKYSLTTREWTYRRQLNDGAEIFDGAGTFAFYDELKNEYLHGGNADAHYRSVAFDLATNSWKPWACPWIYNFGSADARHGRKVGIFNPPSQPDFAYASPGRYFLYNLDTRSVEATGEVAFGDGLTRDAFISGNEFYDGAGMCYVPQLNRYWVVTAMANRSMRFFELDPTTSPWTLRNLATPGTSINVGPNLLRKIVYYPKFGSNGSILLVNRSDENVYLYKF